MKKSKYRGILLASICAFALSSASFLLIPFSRFSGTALQKTLAYLVGILFWSGLIAGLIMTAVLGKARKKARYKKYELPGVLCFFKNKKGKIFDIIMISASVLLLIIDLIGATVTLISMVILSAGVFSVYMHSVFNGNNYSFAVGKEVNK